jgi:hypothetical protein
VTGEPFEEGPVQLIVTVLRASFINVVGVKGVSGYYAAIKEIEVLAILKPTRLRACTAKV